jgi:hypothetical protein
MNFEIGLAQCRGKFLDGVAQHRPRHACGVFTQEPFFGGAIAIADLAQHPTRGFVNEVVTIVEKRAAIANASRKSPRRMKEYVASVAIRRSHNELDRASSYRGARGALFEALPVIRLPCSAVFALPYYERSYENTETLSLQDAERLLGSQWHEERVVALLILVRRFDPVNGRRVTGHFFTTVP